MKYVLRRSPIKRSPPEVLYAGGEPEVGYQDLGLRYWLLADAGAFDPVGRRLADGHYSRRTPGSRQFMPPGQRFVLITKDGLSVWGWWRPHPEAFAAGYNGLDGWTCTIFRRTGGPLASLLVLDAERAVPALGYTCGKSGFLTYIWDRKLRSINPGFCFKVAGWHAPGGCGECSGLPARSRDKKKTLLHKSFSLAGVPP